MGLVTFFKGISKKAATDVAPVVAQNEVGTSAADVPVAGGELPVIEETTNKEEVEGLKKTVEELTKEVAELKATQPTDLTATQPTEDNTLEELMKDKNEVKSEIPGNTPTTEPNTTEAPKVAAVAAPAFRISYILNREKGFSESYFVAQSGDEIRARRMDKVIPASVQTAILASIKSTGKAPENIVSPSEIVEELNRQGVNSLELFDQAMTDMETKAHTLTRTAASNQGAPLYALNTAESKPASFGSGSDPLVALDTKGAVEVPLTGSTNKSVVGKYYQKAFSGAGNETVTNALNPKSSINDAIEVAKLRDQIAVYKKAALDARKAAEEMKAEADKAKADTEVAHKELGDLKEKDEKSQTSEKLDSIVDELVSKKLISEKDEKVAIGHLSKIDAKSLPHVSALIGMLGKSSESDDVGDLFGDSSKPKGATPPALPAPKPAAGAFGGLGGLGKKSASVIPQPFVKPNSGADDDVTWLSQNWD